MYNVHYLRSFDPDVDADEHGQYRTTNEIISQKIRSVMNIVEYVPLVQKLKV